METAAVGRAQPLVLTDGGPGDGLLRRLRLAPAQQHARRAAVTLGLVAWFRCSCCPSSTAWRSAA